MIRFSPLVAVLLLGACDSKDPDRAAFERVAHDAAPVIQRLRDSAATVLFTDGVDDSADKRIINACLGPSQELEALEAIDFENRKVAPAHGEFPVSQRARWILEQGHLLCREIKDVKECSKFCLTAWASLALAIEHFRGDAARHGVDAPSLIYK